MKIYQVVVKNISKLLTHHDQDGDQADIVK